MYSVKENKVKNPAYYFFDKMINIKNLNPNKIKINEKSYKKIRIDYISYETTNCGRPLYFNISKINI